MGRIFVTLAAVAGVALLTAMFIPPMRTAAFGNAWGVTWVMVAALATGLLAFKITK